MFTHEKIKVLFFWALSATIFFYLTFPVKAQVKVRGYYRKDGTYVKPHIRSNPDGNPYNNYGFPGNYNPNTNKITGGDPIKYLERYFKKKGYDMELEELDFKNFLIYTIEKNYVQEIYSINETICKNNTCSWNITNNEKDAGIFLVDYTYNDNGKKGWFWEINLEKGIVTFINSTSDNELYCKYNLLGCNRNLLKKQVLEKNENDYTWILIGAILGLLLGKKY